MATTFNQFSFKFDIYKPLLKTMLKFEFQHSTLKTSFQNGRLKFGFFIQNDHQNQLWINNNKMSEHIDFDPFDHKHARILCIWSIILVK